MSELVHRPISEDDATLEQDGNVLMAVSRRKVHHLTLEAKERVPLHVMKWPLKRQTLYLMEVARRLRSELDRQEAGRPERPKPSRRERRARGFHLPRNRAVIIDQMRDNRMSRVLNSRLEVLLSEAEQKSQAAYHQQSPEHYGFANGLRAAAAIMVGRDHEPLRYPDAWLSDVASAKAEVEALEAGEPDAPEELLSAPAEELDRKVDAGEDITDYLDIESGTRGGKKIKSASKGKKSGGKRT